MSCGTDPASACTSSALVRTASAPLGTAYGSGGWGGSTTGLADPLEGGAAHAAASSAMATANTTGRAVPVGTAMILSYLLME
jgi:hypothetical protein